MVKNLDLGKCSCMHLDKNNNGDDTLKFNEFNLKNSDEKTILEIKKKMTINN